MGDLSAIQSLDLNSLAFFIFAGLAVLVYRGVLIVDQRLGERAAWLRSVTITGLNLAFLSYFVDGWTSFALLMGLFAITYAIARVKLATPDTHEPLKRLFVGVILTLWLLLFLAKDPDLASFANPFAHVPLKVIGISFIFFRCINYIEDIKVLPKHGPITFFAYLVFFPTLIAGPLERCDRFIDNLNQPKQVTQPVVWASLNRIATGVIKKFILADMLYPMTGFGGVDPVDATVWALWLIFFLHLFVLYLDFSGYTDMMLGIGRLMGFELIENFDRPFLAHNVQEFWNRWHISLTSFIRDYVFNPLMRVGLTKAGPAWAFPISVTLYFVTMMIIALWHDTTWGFVVFGLLHGTGLVYVQIRQRYSKTAKGPVGAALQWQAPIWIGIPVTYCFISLTMLFWTFGVSTSFLVIWRMISFN